MNNYVENRQGSEKGTSLLESIPKDIKIKDLEIISTKNLKITSDVATLTNIINPEQEGMVYYIPYNWRVENNTSMDTSILVGLTVFGTMLSSAAEIGGEITKEFASAATLMIIPSPVLNQINDKFNCPTES